MKTFSPLHWQAIMCKRLDSSAKLGLYQHKQQHCSGVWDGRAETCISQRLESKVSSRETWVELWVLEQICAGGKTVCLKVPSVSAVCSYILHHLFLLSCLAELSQPVSPASGTRAWIWASLLCAEGLIPNLVAGLCSALSSQQPWFKQPL